MKKQILLLLPLAALIAAPSHAGNPDDSEGTFTVTPAYVSEFMFRGARYGGASFQPMIEYSKGPLDLELWCNFPLADKIEGVSDPEFDLTASYTLTIVPNAFTIKPGFTLYTFPRAKKEDGFYKATFEPKVSFSYTAGDISFALNLYYDLVMEGPTYEFGVDYSIPVKASNFNFELELSALIGKYDWADSVADSGTKEGIKGDYWQAGLAVPFEFSKSSKLVIGWYYAEGINTKSYAGAARDSLPDVGHGVFNVSFSHSF